VTTREQAFVLAAPDRVTRTPPQRSPDPGKGPGPRTTKRRNEGKEWSRQLPGMPRPRQRGQRSRRPNDALRASPRHDHPDAPARRRGHPWPLERASAVPTDRGVRGLSEETTTRPRGRARLTPAAPAAKSPAQGRIPGIPVESHLRSSTEPRKSRVRRKCPRMNVLRHRRADQAVRVTSRSDAPQGPIPTDQALSAGSCSVVRHGPIPAHDLRAPVEPR
jgi:hypothetical protein